MSDSEERAPKRLRSIEPDLKIILGSGDDVSTQWHHAASLALKSKYIDTMLSNPMREQETRTITFPDVSRDIWDRMNMFLDDPLAARDMKIRDVKDLALLYDKYEFNLGCKLCEQIMVDYFRALPSPYACVDKSLKLDLDLVIDLTTIAHEANLSAAFQRGIDYLLWKLDHPNLTLGRGMFIEEHLKKILPLLKYKDNTSSGDGDDMLFRVKQVF